MIEERRGVYRKLVVRDDRLAGAVLVGDASAAAGLVRRFERGDPLPANRLDLFASPGPRSRARRRRGLQLPPGDRTDAARSRPRRVPHAARLAARTGAGTGCGSCRGQLASLLLLEGREASRRRA